MATIKQNHSLPFQQTASGTTSAVATQTGVANTTYYITDISGSSDKAGALILVKNGTTIIWQDIINTTAYTHSFIQPLKGSIGADVSVTVDGTAASKANMAGFIVNNT